MHKSDFPPFSDPFMLSVDASGVVPVGVRPPPPLRGSSPPLQGGTVETFRNNYDTRFNTKSK